MLDRRRNCPKRRDARIVNEFLIEVPFGSTFGIRLQQCFQHILRVDDHRPKLEARQIDVSPVSKPELLV